MKLVLGHVDDRFAPEMTAELLGDDGKTLDHWCGYCPPYKIANVVAVNAVKLLKKLDSKPENPMEISIEKDSRAFYPPEDVAYIEQRIRNYLGEPKNP
jgi:hypothetical protein